MQVEREVGTGKAQSRLVSRREGNICTKGSGGPSGIYIYVCMHACMHADVSMLEVVLGENRPLELSISFPFHFLWQCVVSISVVYYKIFYEVLIN